MSFGRYVCGDMMEHMLFWFVKWFSKFVLKNGEIHIIKEKQEIQQFNKYDSLPSEK